MTGRFFRLVLPMLVLCANGAAMAQSLPTGIATGETTKGKVLTDGRGFTLYVFDQDKDGQSACVDRCAENWGPLKVAEGAQATTDFTIILRSDGPRQWSYHGHPLYTFIKDANPGEIQGDGVRDLWHIAKP
jgi:predicted lipoprotein with Yx(FWY)xxD motif